MLLSGKGQGELVVAGRGWSCDVGQTQHLHAVAVRVGRLSNVHLGCGEGYPIAGRGAVKECQVSERGAQGGAEVVLRRNGRCFDHHRASRLAT